MPVLSRSLKELFLAALEVPADDRSRWLDDTCGSDFDLRDKLEALLHAHATPQNLFEYVMPASFREPRRGERPSTLPGSTEEPGTWLGSYRLLQQIGEGGMGTVWMAQQTEPVSRKVAVKLLRSDLGSHAMLARFEVELQSLALMEHPNIARVLDAGRTTDGRPYIVMELIHGQPITTFCDDHHLPLRERLALFVTACRAIQHTHLKGVIHRDLKPSNVLVELRDDRPLVKVIDFGIARTVVPECTPRERMTLLGVVVGTPEYMSPEQSRLDEQDIDTRSDIYSLGVLLYELLTGTTPLNCPSKRSTPLLEMLRTVREGETPQPSARLAIHPNLPTLARDRGLGPAALRQTVQGDLDWIAMKALEKERSRRYQTAGELADDVERYLHDHEVHARPPSLAYRLHKLARRHRRQLVMLGLLTLALLIAAGGIGWALWDRSTQRLEAARARSERLNRLSTQLEALVAEADRFVTQQNATAALQAARRAEAILVGTEADEPTQIQVAHLLRELHFLDRLDQIRLIAATWKDDAFDRQSANLAYRQAFLDFGLEVERDGATLAGSILHQHARIARPIAQALDHWVMMKWLAGEQAEPQRRPLIELANRLDPEEPHRQLRSLWGRPVTPALIDELRRLVDSTNVEKLGPSGTTILASTLKTAGLPSHQEKLLRQAQLRYPGDFWLNLSLATVLRDAGNLSEELQFARAAVALRPSSTAAWNNLGCTLLDQRRLSEAEDCFHRALSLNPEDHLLHRNLGRVRVAAGQLEDAITSFRRAHTLAPKDPAPLNHLARTLNLLGNIREARETLDRAITLDPNNANLHNNLGLLLKTSRQFAAAQACFEKAADLDPHNTLALNNLGELLCEQGKPEEAVTWHQKAIAINARSAASHNFLARALAMQGKLGPAIDSWRRAVQLDPNDAAAHRNLGQALLARDDYAGASTAFHRALALNPRYTDVYYQLAYLLNRQGKLDEAVAAYRKTLDLDPNHINACNNLGSLLMQQRKASEAIACFRKAVQAQPEIAGFHQNLGNALLMQQNWNEGLSSLRRAAKLAPENPAILTNLAQALLTAPSQTQQLTDEALSHARRAVEIRPDEPTVETLAVAAARARRWDDAVKARQQLARLRPPDALDKFLLALTHWQAGHRNEALKWYALADSDSAKLRDPGEVLLETQRDADRIFTPAKASPARNKNP